MPDQIVWIDKVLNPRSAVLTHNEAMTVLKNAKSWLSRPRHKATTQKLHGTEKKLSLAQQKDEYIKLQKMFLQQDELKPILEMQAELEALEKSKEVYKNAVEERYLLTDGLPRLKPSLLLKKEIVRSKRIKGNEVAEKLALMDKSAINKNALKRILADDNDDGDTKDETPMEIYEPKVEVPPKRRRVIISDDETDDDEDRSKDSKAAIQVLPQEPKETTLEFANDRLEFKHAFSSYADFVQGAPITFQFEATTKDTTTTKVLALTEEISDVLEDSDTPTNVMFTDYAISGIFNPPEKEQKDPEEALRTYWLGNSTEKYGSTALTDTIKPPSNLGKSGKTNYNELIKDERFCSKLLKSCEADWDVSTYFEMDGDFRARDNEYLPKLQTLNSLFCAFDLDLLQYQADVAAYNACRVRERQRVQHPTVKVRPEKKELPLASQRSTVMMMPKSSTLPNAMNRCSNGSKSAAATIKQEDGENKNCISHNTIIHEALKYLEKSQTAHRYQSEIKDAYKKLSKYPLTFLEKMNLIQTSPKDLPGMLCVLDDLGLRFSKEVMEDFERDCSSLWIPKRHRIKRNSSTTA